MKELDLEQELWQIEARTRLAWSRSGLSVLTCVLLFGRRLTELVGSGRGQVFALALVVVVSAVAGLFALAWRGHKLRHVHRRFGAITTGTATLAVVGFVLALFPPD